MSAFRDISRVDRGIFQKKRKKRVKIEDFPINMGMSHSCHALRDISRVDREFIYFNALFSLFFDDFPVNTGNVTQGGHFPFSGVGGTIQNFFVSGVRSKIKISL